MSDDCEALLVRTERAGVSRGVLGGLMGDDCEALLRWADRVRVSRETLEAA
jgi:hypothetical protein